MKALHQYWGDVDSVLREVFFFCVAIVLGVAMRLGILGVAIKPLEAGVLVTDGLLWDLHVSVVNWLSLCLGGTADANAGGSEGLDVPTGVSGVGTLTAHPNPFTGGPLFDGCVCTLLCSTFALTLGVKLLRYASSKAFLTLWRALLSHVNFFTKYPRR